MPRDVHSWCVLLLFFPFSTSNATNKFLAQLQHIAKASHRGASWAPAIVKPVPFCCSRRADGIPLLCARRTRSRAAARRGKPGFCVPTVRCVVDAHQASGVPESGAGSAPCLDRLRMPPPPLISAPHVLSGAGLIACARVKYSANPDSPEDDTPVGRPRRKPRSFQRLERCRWVPTCELHWSFLQEQGAWCVLVLCRRSFGAARLKAGAWCSLEAGFKLLAARTMLCQAGWVIPPALAAKLSAEASLRAPVSLMRRASPAFSRLTGPFIFGALVLCIKPASTPRPPQNRAIFRPFRPLLDFSSPMNVD